MCTIANAIDYIFTKTNAVVYMFGIINTIDYTYFN